MNLVMVQRSGNHKVYSISGEKVERFFRSLRELALDRLAELRHALAEVSRTASRSDVVERAEFKEKVHAGEALVVDVRPREEYEQSHVPGSLSIPLSELESRLDELLSQRDKEIIVLCRGRYCILADRAIPILRDLGLRARRADGGVIGWDVDEVQDGD